MQLPVTWDWPDAELEEEARRARRLRSTEARPTSVDAALRELLDRGTAQGRSLGGRYQLLWAEVAAATEDGKRLRPALLEASYRAWGGTDAHAAATIGAAIELLHTAFVIHDDVIDDDDHRRGRLNVSGAHAADARRRGVDDAHAHEYGVAAGILAGDLALTAALRAVATCAVPTGTVHRLLDLFDSALHATAAGELADVLQGVFGDPAATGKSTLSDLRAGKQTSLIVHARGTDRWAEVAPYIGDGTIGEAEGSRVRDLLDASGSRTFVRLLASQCARNALSLGERTGMPPILVSWLRDTTRDLLGR